MLLDEPMFEQASLPGLEAPAAGTDTLFFAVLPDPQTAARIHELAWRLRARHGLHAKPMPAEQLHISLQILGAFAGVPTDALALAQRAAERCRLASSFDVTLDRVLSFAAPGDVTRSRAFVMRESRRAEGLLALHVLLSQGLRALDQTVIGGRGFMPHLTLLYDTRRIVEEAVTPICWHADSVALVRGQAGTGRAFEILQRWPLARAATGTR